MLRRIVNIRPIVIVASGFCSGLFFASASAVSPALGAVLLACALALALFSLFLFPKRRSRTRVVLTACAMLAAALAFLGAFVQFARFSAREFPDRVYAVNARIDGVTDYGNGYYRLILSDVSFKNGGTKYKIALYLSGKEGEFDVGKRIAFSSSLEQLPLVSEGRISANNVVNGVKYRAELGAEDTYTLSAGKQTVFERANAFLRSSLEAGLGEEEFPVAFALLTGDETLMDGEVLQNFRSGGVAHIFAVSGLHIGFLYAALSFLAQKLRVPRTPAFFIILAALFFYAGVCGFTASSVRAAVMCAVSMCAKRGGMKYDGLSALAFAAAAVCLVSPAQFFTAGYRLSFAAVFGILLLSRRISSALKFLPEKLASALGASLSAQLGGLPVCLWYFSNLSPFAVALNLFAVPAVSVLFIALLFGAIVGGAFSVPVPALFLQKYLVRFVVETVMLVDYGGLTITFICMGAALAAAYYALLLLSAGMVNLKEKTLRAACVFLAAVVVGGTAFSSVREYRAADLVVVAEANFHAVCLSCRGENYIVVLRAEGLFSAYGAERFLSARGEERADVLFAAEDIDVIAALSRLSRRAEIGKIYFTGEYDAEVLARIFSRPAEDFIRVGEDDGIPIGEHDLRADGKTAVFSFGEERLLFSSAEYAGGAFYDFVAAPSFAEDAEERQGQIFLPFAEAAEENFSLKIYER